MVAVAPSILQNIVRSQHELILVRQFILLRWNSVVLATYLDFLSAEQWKILSMGYENT